MQRGPQLEARFVFARLLSALRGRQRRRRRRGRGGELGEVRFDGDIARGELSLIDVEEFEVLLEHEDVFGPVVTGEGRDDLGFGGATAIVPMRGQLMRIAVTGHDVPEDTQTGHPPWCR